MRYENGMGFSRALHMRGKIVLSVDASHSSLDVRSIA